MSRAVEIRLDNGDVRRLVVLRNGEGARILVFDDDVDVPLVEATVVGPELEQFVKALEE